MTERIFYLHPALNKLINLKRNDLGVRGNVGGNLNPILLKCCLQFLIIVNISI